MRYLNLLAINGEIMMRIKEGDLFEIETPEGKAYFQHIIKDPMMGHLIRVFPKIYSQALDYPEAIVKEKESFFTYFPLAAALKKNIVRYVGKSNVPFESKKPTFMRQALSIGNGGKVLNWRIINMDSGEIEVVESLSEDQKKLSLRECWNDTLLIERICERWKPEFYS